MVKKIINGIEYRRNSADQWIAQRFEIHRYIDDRHISTLTGGQAISILFYGGISHSLGIPLYRS